jgi:peptidoglycan/LPS O-acetylase OafA/YrhL
LPELIADCAIGYFLLQSIIIYAIGIRIVTNMAGEDLSGYSRATGVAFIVSLLVTVLVAEAMYWLVEIPSKWFGRRLFDWIRE